MADYNGSWELEVLAISSFRGLFETTKNKSFVQITSMSPPRTLFERMLTSSCFFILLHAIEDPLWNGAYIDSFDFIGRSGEIQVAVIVGHRD